MAAAWLLYVAKPNLPAKFQAAFKPVYTLLDNKILFGRDLLQRVRPRRARAGQFVLEVGDTLIIDNGIVNGSAKLVGAVVGASAQSANRLYLHLRGGNGVRAAGDGCRVLLGAVV